MINIQSTSYKNNYISFKSRDEDDSCGFDDDISKNRRDYIREHYETRVLPYYDILENNGRLSEYQLNNLINKLCGTKPKRYSSEQDLSCDTDVLDIKRTVNNTNKIDSSIMKTLPLLNVKPIISTGCYRGSTPNSNLNSIKILKEAGVKHVVDLQGYGEVERVCKENHLDYFHIPIAEDLSEMQAFQSERDIELNVKRFAHFYQFDKNPKESMQKAKDDSIARWGKNKDEYIEKFVKMINLLQEDNTYIGCEFGISRTNNAMLLNHLFNPKATRTPSCRTKFNNVYMNDIAKLYYNLKPEHKAQMGWTEEFDKNFIPRLKDLQKSKIELNY